MQLYATSLQLISHQIPTHIPTWQTKCQHGISSICQQMMYVNTFCTLFTIILQLVQQIYSFIILFTHLMQIDSIPIYL
jgi:hypothetical protein